MDLPEWKAEVVRKVGSRSAACASDEDERSCRAAVFHKSLAIFGVGYGYVMQRCEEMGRKPVILHVQLSDGSNGC